MCKEEGINIDLKFQETEGQYGTVGERFVWITVTVVNFVNDLQISSVFWPGSLGMSSNRAGTSLLV